MKYYRLNKDWEPFEEGAVFVKAKDGGDMYTLKINTGVLAKIQPDLLDEVDGGGYWKPKAHEYYYFVDDAGTIDSDIFDPDTIYDCGRLSIGNCFRVRGDVKAMIAWLKAKQQLIESGARFINTIDVDSSQSYYSVYYAIDRGDLVIEDAYVGENTVGDKGLYFDDRQLADKSIKEHKDDWLIYLGVKEDIDD